MRPLPKDINSNIICLLCAINTQCGSSVASRWDGGSGHVTKNAWLFSQKRRLSVPCRWRNHQVFTISSCHIVTTVMTPNILTSVENYRRIYQSAVLSSCRTNIYRLLQAQKTGGESNWKKTTADWGFHSSQDVMKPNTNVRLLQQQSAQRHNLYFEWQMLLKFQLWQRESPSSSDINYSISEILKPVWLSVV